MLIGLKEEFIFHKKMFLVINLQAIGANKLIGIMTHKFH